ncbi:MAG: outer membrane beta-barrel protein [Burkholderiaceae bacterium]
MRKITIALAASAAALLSNGALAAGYVGGNVGQGHMNIDCAGAQTCNQDGTSYKFVGGYGFTENLYGELGYINFGKAKVVDQGLGVGFRSQGVLAAVNYQFNMGESWLGNVRLGAISMKTKSWAAFEGDSGSISETNLKAYFGLGFGYSITKELKLVGEADFSRAEIVGEEASLRSLSLGLRYHF